MPAPSTTLILFACLASLLTACSSRLSKDGAQPGQLSVVFQPTRPQPTVPIDPVGSLLYFEREVTLLLEQGKITTNLLQGIKHEPCALKLILPSERILTSQELARTVEMSVAVVGRIAQEGTNRPCLAVSPGIAMPGTGVFLTELGALATCYHILGDKRVISLAVMTRDGQVCPVREVLAADPTNDVLILQVEGQGFTPAPVASAAPQGSPIWVLSHPEWRFYTLTTGIVSGYLTANPGDGWRTFMNITADFAPGSSGAPVFNEHGAVVGLAHHIQFLNVPDDPKTKVVMSIKSCVPASALLSLIKDVR